MFPKKDKKTEQITRICSVITRIFRLVVVILFGHKGGKNV